MRPEQIRSIRRELKLSQHGMAERLNAIDPGLKVASTSVSRYERGQHMPSDRVLAAYRVIAMESGIDVEGLPSYEDITGAHYRQLVELCDRAIAGERDMGFTPALAQSIRRTAANTLRTIYGIDIGPAPTQE